MTRTLRLLARAVVLTALAGVMLVVTVRLTIGSALELGHAAGSAAAANELTLDRLVGDLASALFLLAASGLAVISALAMTAALAAERAPTMANACARVTPRSCRRLVAALLGLGLSTPVLVGPPAVAGGQGHVQICRDVCPPATTGLAGLGFPDLPSVSKGRARQVVAQRQVVVHEGDSLWRIAERRLPADGTTSQVAELTWRLYALNRSTIGADPDLIYPDMTLLAPEGGS